jgi:hypothetical protein
MRKQASGNDQAYGSIRRTQRDSRSHQKPVSHPAKTFSQPIALTNQAAARILPTTFILTVEKK